MREAAKTTGAVKSAIWWRAEENEGTGRLSNTSAFDLNRHWSKKKVEIFKYERDEDLFQLIQSFFFLKRQRAHSIVLGGENPS